MGIWLDKVCYRCGKNLGGKIYIGCGANYVEYCEICTILQKIYAEN